MKLEVGKKYVRRDGGIEEIVKYDGHETWPFVSARDEDYTEEGRWHPDGFDCKHDLIAEYTEDSTETDYEFDNQEILTVAASGAMREKLSAHPYDLVPFIEMTEAYVRVAEFGSRKYESWNWSKGLPRVQIIGSLLRHTWAYLRGEERDKESGLLHTDHILWNAAALSHNVHWGLEDGRRVEPERGYKNDPNH